MRGCALSVAHAIATRNFDDDDDDDDDDESSDVPGEMERTQTLFHQVPAKRASPFKRKTPPPPKNPPASSPVAAGAPATSEESESETVPLAAARRRAEFLEARVREEEARIERQRKRMLELEREAVERETQVAAAEARRASEAKRLEEEESRSREKLEAAAAARRAAHASKLRALEEEEEKRLAEIAAAREARLRREADESFRDAEARRASLVLIEEQTAELQKRYEELERERAQREAEVSAAEQREAARMVGPHQSLYDVLEEAAAKSPDDDDDDDDEKLPEPHRAAAAGRVATLAALSDEAVLARDAARRTPLFYACAHGREECVDLLLRRAPRAAETADANGDAPLHAAVSAGAAGCARRLVDAAAPNEKKFVERANGLGMRAAHLASNVACLEVLLEAGASFFVEDAQRRTPLFVACAMNRFECATFLLEVADLEPPGSISAVDARGDTALHAAACNGAEACVRLLLESGIQCDLSNHHGLRAVDLAARRGHAGCRRLLAEYHLHHSARSRFDSVLFLATIEGHRQCKRHLEQQQGYEIIRRGVAAAENSNSLEASAYRAGREMKLAQWGSWIAYENPDNLGVFWYNHLSGDAQWTKPDSVRDAQTRLGSERSKWEAMRTNSMRLAQLGDWIMYREKGCAHPFYYHPATGDFAWERPDDRDLLADRPLNTTTRPPAPATTSWTSYADAATGATFWYNHLTHQSQWDRPDDDLATTLLEEQPGDLHQQQEDHAAVVDNINDLGI
ncbi:hypothetical protein CTAYLR_000845 [Chrysophaeum taylorii]|uniref:WW domain-containing protein n=1 Tax=Chrysophaeum taylorii TaxID=2483200 RepID=A0AAD7UQU8_9STRA|nr:hypothetical protein CTAYLR_000845 [Chrysophaeum taylorii]